MSQELRTIHIVFDPAVCSSPDMIFVEVETEDGTGVVAGKWVDHPTSPRFRVLRLRVAAEDIHAINE